MHAHPELCFEEHHAAERPWPASWPAAASTSSAGVAELPTAFAAAGRAGPADVAICAEYDALPGVGHACGHNIIAAAAVGAGLGLAGVADELGLTVACSGTPAEEGGGGKVLLLERGAFDGVHAAMMVHPWPTTGWRPPAWPSTTSTSLHRARPPTPRPPPGRASTPATP